MMTTKSFPEWLSATLIERDMRPADLARTGQINKGILSRVLRGERKPSNETLEAVARALRLPKDFVFEKAGLLLPKSELSAKKRELLARLENADDATVQTVIEILEVAVRNQQRQVSGNLNPKTTPH